MSYWGSMEGYAQSLPVDVLACLRPSLSSIKESDPLILDTRCRLRRPYGGDTLVDGGTEGQGAGRAHSPVTAIECVANSELSRRVAPAQRPADARVAK